MITGGQTSRFEVIPKYHQSDKWGLIVDLSDPKGHCINDGIAESLCSLKYNWRCYQQGVVTWIWYLNGQSYYTKCVLPLISAAADRHFQQMKWNNLIFMDTCLPFGLQSAPRLFIVLADLIQWISQQQGVSYIIHYLRRSFLCTYYVALQHMSSKPQHN